MRAGDQAVSGAAGRPEGGPTVKLDHRPIAGGSGAASPPVESVTGVDSARPLKLDGSARAMTTRLAMVLSLAAILAFVLLITLPFTSQALHVDDFLFWDFAKNNLEHPLQQHLPDFHLMGENVSAFRDTHPPVDELYLSLIMRLSGTTDSEPVMHLGFVVFPLIAGVSMFFLSRRFTRNALLATLLLLATPVLMVMSHNLMGDLPMTAFWLAATALYVNGVDRSNIGLLTASGLVMTIAVFTGYQALALILLLPLYSLLAGRFSWKTALPVALPLVCFGLYSWYNVSAYGALPRFSHAHGLSFEQDRVLSRVQGLLTGVGGATVFPLFMAGAFALRRRRWLLMLPAAAASVWLALHHQSADGFPLMTTALFAAFVFAAGMALVMILTEAGVQLARRIKRLPVDTDFLFLAAWIVALMAGVALLLPQATARYYLPFLAPLILLMFRETEAVIRSKFTMRMLAAVAIIFTFVTATALSAADFQLAEAYKDYALGVNSKFQPQGAVWFVGEWGFRHYMESAGYKYLTSTDTSPADGDLVIKAGLMDWPLDPSVSDRMHLVGMTATQWAAPVRLMNFDNAGGFYGSFWGLLPFAITDQPLEKFEVYRLEKPGP